ncbi:NACHT domain-containing protein [Streptosporangium sp. NPDC049376]|uniref:NACHT domain-containing protein n=1 Tax=Streptosporangium sp. NPDC049376 TaxID=3366192 RepID=UPI0037A2FE87
MALDPAALAVGRAVVQRVIQVWMAERTARIERNSDLSDLIKVRFSDQISRRRASRQLADIVDSVTERIVEICKHEFSGLADNDKEAVLAEILMALQTASLSDKDILADDMNAAALSRRIRKSAPQWGTQKQLGEAGSRLYDIILDECCDCLMRIVVQLPQFMPRSSVEILSRLTELAHDVSTLMARLPARAVIVAHGAEADSEFSQQYLECLGQALDKLELFGVRFERLRRPQTALSVAYIGLRASVEGQSHKRGTRHSAVPLAEWRNESAEQATSHIEDILSKNQFLLIRGEAGAGKSTLLRWIAVTASRGNFSSAMVDWNGCIPFLVKLRSYAFSEFPGPEKFIDGVANHLVGIMPQGWAHRILASPRAVLLVDGVDELPGSQRDAARDWLKRLIVSYPGIRVIVTSRPAAASTEWLSAEGFKTAFLERMSPSEISSLVRHWHRAIRYCPDLPCVPEKVPSYEAALLARFEAAPHLRMLASTPLLAAMICALNLDQENQLPRDRMGLYRSALDLMLENRDLKRNITITSKVSLTRDQKVRLLQELAWQLSTTNRVELPKVTAKKVIADRLLMMPQIELEASEVLDYLLQRSGVIREPVIGRIDFIHRTVQEYLAAKHAADLGDMDLLIRNAHRDLWRETIIMTAGHASAASAVELITGLLDRIEQEHKVSRRLKLVVASCLETLLAIPLDLQRHIQQCLDDLIPPRTDTAARSLALIGAPVLSRLPQEIGGLKEREAVATVRTAWLINGPAAIETLSRYASDPRDSVQGELRDAWRYFDADAYAQSVLTKAPQPRSVLVFRAEEQFHALRLIPDISDLDIWLPELPNWDFIDRYSHCLKSIGIHLDSDHEPIDLRPLTRLKHLTQVNVSARVADLSFLEETPLLSSVWLTDCSQIRDYSSLQRHKSLGVLFLHGCPELKSAAALPDLQKVRTLGLAQSQLDCGVEEIVRRAPKVRCLYLEGCPWVTDLSPLGSLQLYDLRVRGCSGIRNLEGLQSLTQLSHLDLSGSSISDLAPIGGLKNLRILRISNCSAVSDLSPLASLSGLQELMITGDTGVTDLGPVSDNELLRVYVNRGHKLRNADKLGHRVRYEWP